MQTQMSVLETSLRIFANGYKNRAYEIYKTDRQAAKGISFEDFCALAETMLEQIKPEPCGKMDVRELLQFLASYNISTSARLYPAFYQWLEMAADENGWVETSEVKAGMDAFDFRQVQCNVMAWVKGDEDDFFENWYGR